MSETQNTQPKGSARRPSGNESNENLAEWNQEMVEEFRANNGRVGGMFETLTLTLLTTTGARSGRLTTTPMAYYTDTDGERYIMLASNFGREQAPAWYHNILRTPEVTMEIASPDGDGTRSFRAKAHVIEGPERDRLFDWVVDQMPGYAEYQRNMTRLIPVVALERVA